MHWLDFIIGWIAATTFWNTVTLMLWVMIPSTAPWHKPSEGDL